MKLLELTLATPAQNLALDEALLEAAEDSGESGGVLRLWESSQPLVVLGRSSQVAQEVRQGYCRANGIEIGRRASGGATIVCGPGCLMYALVLSYESYPAAKMLDQAHRVALAPMVQSLTRLDHRVQRSGTSDLALGDRKFSGNSLRCRRSHFLYHGTLLYDFPLTMIGEALATAPRQPEYRRGRSHWDFVTNFPVGKLELRDALIDAWSAEEPLKEWPQQRCESLARTKYTSDQWTLGR